MTDYSGIRSSELSTLLTEFLNSGKSDASFTQIVDTVGGLIYGSALRRVGNPELAEEIAQNVFCILATKAEKLSQHPCLLSWLHRTTRFEAANVLKKEIRHRERIEKLAHHEAMDTSPETQNVSGETLRLIEQAIDQLGVLDRQLILARHFEGKKFREIAKQVNRSEDACRVRLRRALAKMAGWLSKKGCTLSISALVTILSSELTKACPVTFSVNVNKITNYSASAESSLLNPLTAVSPLSLTSLAVSLSFCVLAIGVPLALSYSSSNPSPGESSISRKEYHSDRSLRTTEERLNAAMGILSTYPLAHDRLEEIYKIYPNLRPGEFTHPTELTLIEALTQKFDSNYELFKKLEIPSEIKNQMLGKVPWNNDAVSEFLSSRQNLLTELIELSNFSTDHPKLFYRFTDSTPEASLIRVSCDFLNLAISRATRNGEHELSTLLQDTQERFLKSLSAGNLVHLQVASALSINQKKTLIALGKDGHIAPKPSPFIHPLQYADALRSEVAGMISFLEAVHSFHDRDLIKPGVITFTQMSSHDPDPHEKKELEALFLKADIRAIEEHYSAMMSNAVSVFSYAATSSTEENGNRFEKQLQLGPEWFPKPYGPLLKLIAPSYAAKEIKKSQEHTRLNLEIQTYNAINQANRNDFSFASLAELVPTYLPGIPVDPKTSEPFIYNPQTGSLEAPNTKLK